MDTLVTNQVVRNRSHWFQTKGQSPLLVDVPYCHIAMSAINNALVQHVREDRRLEAREGSLKKPNKGATLLHRDTNGK